MAVAGDVDATATECRWVTFGSKVNGLDAAVSFYEYAEDGHLLHKTPLDIKARTASICYWLVDHMMMMMMAELLHYPDMSHPALG